MLLMSVNPAMAAVIAYFSLDEHLSFIAIIGMALTLAGIYIVIGTKENNINKQFTISPKGITFGLLAALGQAIGLLLAKMAFNDAELNGLAATQVRIIAAIILMFPLLVITGKFKNSFKLFGKDYKLLGTLTIGSIIGPYLGITLSYIAIIYTKVGIAATLMSLVPVTILPVTRIVYKEHLTPATITGTIIAVAGVAILFLR
jgi:drug/metabolite transporter (DMT)-like permease